jgi:cyclophilin family peptidyl-prolyl cis-trans isomerase
MHDGKGRTMTKTHRTKRDARREARARRKLYIRILTIGIIILAAALILWLVVRQVKTGGSSTATLQTSSTQVPTPGGPTPKLVGTKQYSAAPPMLIDLSKQYFATVKMAKGGEFVIQLYPDKAPITVNSFVFLARNGFYNGVTFHRVIAGFMAQTGDPTGTGSGGPGYSFVNETNNLTFDQAGVVAMANAGPNTNGSQFFITFGPVNLLESAYTIFGQVTSGMNVVNGITPRDPTQNPTYTGDVMDSITITEK